jgi:hyaluronan synthase
MGRTIMLFLSIMGIAMLAIAIFIKLSNLELLLVPALGESYSIAVGAFILSRFIIAAFYIAPPDVGFQPTAAVVMAGPQ